MNNQNIVSTSWLTNGISAEQLEIEKNLAIISAEIYTKRCRMGLDQKAFAKYMGVSQGLISRWESGTYNFSVATLVKICGKLNLRFEPEIYKEGDATPNISFVCAKTIAKDSTAWQKWSLDDVQDNPGGVA